MTRPRLWAITDRARMGPEPLARARALLERFGPAVGVQIREKDLPPRALLGWVDALVEVASATGGHLAINGRVDLALLDPRLGVQLPADGLSAALARRLLGPSRAIGVSLHAGDAPGLATSASFGILSPVFAVPGKGPPLGLAGFAEIAHSYGDLPIYALGGLGPARFAEAVRHGAAGVAAVSACWTAPPDALGRAVAELVAECDTRES